MKNKKAISEIGWIWIIIAFIVMVVLFIVLFSIFGDRVENKVEERFSANQANIVLNNLIYQEVEYDGRMLTVAELIDDYVRSTDNFASLTALFSSPRQEKALQKKCEEYMQGIFGEDVKWQINVYSLNKDSIETRILFMKSSQFHKSDGKTPIRQIIPLSDKKWAKIELRYKVE